MCDPGDRREALSLFIYRLVDHKPGFCEKQAGARQRANMRARPIALSPNLKSDGLYRWVSMLDKRRAQSETSCSFWKVEDVNH